MVFLRHELFWSYLVQVSTTQFCCFPPVFMARVGDASDRPVPPVQLSSSNFGFPNGSSPDIDGLATRLGTSSDEKVDIILSKLAHFSVQLAQLDVSNGITRYIYIWRICGSTRRDETEFQRSQCARSKQVQFPPQVSPARHDWPSQVDGSTAAGSHDPGSPEQGRDTRHRLRSDVLLRFLCEQCHAGVSAWLKKTLATADTVLAADLLLRIHCKTGAASARLVLSTRTKCQEFVATCRDDGLPMRCYNKLLVMQTIRHRIARPMCDGCSSLVRLTGRDLFHLCGFPFRWLLHVTSRPCRRQPSMNTCLVIAKSNKSSAAVWTAPRPIFFRPPIGLERVNPY